MTDTQTPPAEPYEVDDYVKIRLADGEAESEFEGMKCRVVHVFADEAGSENVSETDTDREMDRSSYRLVEAETGDRFPVVFRHRDLVPIEAEL